MKKDCNEFLIRSIAKEAANIAVKFYKDGIIASNAFEQMQIAISHLESVVVNDLKPKKRKAKKK